MRMWAIIGLLIQLIAASWHSWSQWTLLWSATDVKIGWFLFWWVFLITNLFLTHQAYRKQPKLSRWIARTNYAIWLIAISGDLLLICRQQAWHWLNSDFFVAGALICWIIISKNDWQKPKFFGILGVICRCLPQTLLAIQMLWLGGSDLAGGMLMAGYIAIVGRLGNIYLGGKDIHLKWAFIAELLNLLTWFLMTLVWIFY